MSARRHNAVARADPGAAPIFAALGDETRLALVGRLSASGPLSIVTLTDGTGVTRQAVTKHLHVLSDAGLVRDSWIGRERVWQLEPESLFVWGKQDKLVPIAFARHVERALPNANHLELNCGHVPQIERPEDTHEAIRRFLTGARSASARPSARSAARSR